MTIGLGKVWYLLGHYLDQLYLRYMTKYGIIRPYTVNTKLSDSIYNRVLWNYYEISNIRGTLVGNNIFDHSVVVVASPVGTAPTTSLFST